VGAVVAAFSGPLGASDTDSSVTGGLSAGLLGHYFLHRNFALGLEGGIRAQFVNLGTGPSSSTLYSVAAIYVALSLSFVAGS
jgi:hypothetical protein